MRIRLNHKRLVALLAESKLSQNHWAIRLGLSKGHWSQIVNGKHPYPSQKTRDLLLEALGVSFEELFTHESQPGVDADFQAAIADRYLLDKELGHGGMGTVYLARDVKHGRLVAVKVVSPEAVSGIGVAQFLREIRYTARLEHHHILPLHDSGHAAGHPFYVMPYIRGGSLRDRLNRDRLLPVGEVLTITRGVAGALQHAHDRQVLHCDVKPENVLLSDDHAYVADFGISRAIHTEVFEWGRRREIDSSAGTPAYVSPEQATGEQNLDARSDVYSLGCMVFELLSGEKPFAGTTTAGVVSQRFRETVPNLTGRAPHLPATLATAVQRAMTLDPDDRTPTAAVFLANLERGAKRRSWPALDATGRAATAMWSLGRRALGLGKRTRRGTLLENVWQDVRYVGRSLLRRPAFAAAAVGTLALGIGAITAIFSVVNAVLFRPLDYPEADRLVALEFLPANAEAQSAWASFEDYMARHARRSVTYPNFERWRDAAGDIFAELGIHDDTWTYDINFGGGTERLPGTIVSAGVFRALGVPPAVGRWFSDEEDIPGSARAVVLSYGLWQRRLGGRTDAVGRTVQIREEPYTVVGIMPRGFGFPSPAAQFWIVRSWNWHGTGVSRSSLPLCQRCETVWSATPGRCSSYSWQPSPRSCS
jgi:transcriptional regulator with XRE-family HTH domain